VTEGLFTQRVWEQLIGYARNSESLQAQTHTHVNNELELFVNYAVLYFQLGCSVGGCVRLYPTCRVYLWLRPSTAWLLYRLTG